MGLMGLGGLLAIAGGLLFVVVVARARCAQPAAHDGSTDDRAAAAHAARGLHARRGAVQPRLRRPPQPAVPPGRDQLLPVLGGRRHRPRALRLLRHQRHRRLPFGGGHHARAVGRRRRAAQRAPPRLGRDGADDADPHAALLRLRPPARLSLVLVGHRRGADLAGLRGRRQRLHAALGPAGAVRHPGQLRVAGLAARLRRHADPQLHPARARQRPPVLAARLHPHRRAAGHAAGDVDPRAARAQGRARSRRGPSRWR